MLFEVGGGCAAGVPEVVTLAEVSGCVVGYASANVPANGQIMDGR